MVHRCPITRNNRADFVSDFVADCVTDFCIFLSYKSVGKSFGVTYALLKAGSHREDCERLEA